MGELTAAETVLCQYWRCVLEVGAIYSIEQLPTNEGSTGPATFLEALASFTHKADESDAVQRSRLFFDIVHSRPAGRVQAESTGRAADTSDVIVRVYDGVQVKDSTPTLRADSAHTVHISLRDWCLTVTLTPILSTLLRWEIADSSTTVATNTSTQHLQSMGRPVLLYQALFPVRPVRLY